jgi:small subunit ribosomal protein S9
MPGRGLFDINGKDLDYFSLIRARESIIYPLQLVDWLGTVDIQATVTGSGEMGQAAALRWGVATGIAALGN